MLLCIRISMMCGACSCQFYSNLLIRSLHKKCVQCWEHTSNWKGADIPSTSWPIFFGGPSFTCFTTDHLTPCSSVVQRFSWIAWILLYIEKGRVRWDPSYTLCLQLAFHRFKKGWIGASSHPHILLYCTVDEYLSSYFQIEVRMECESARTLTKVWPRRSDFGRGQRGLGAFNMPPQCLCKIERARSKPSALWLILPDPHREKTPWSRLQKYWRVWKEISALWKS